jgi:hypothetical protein
VELAAGQARLLPPVEFQHPLPDYEPLGVEVYVLPTETKSFATPKAGGSDHLEQSNNCIV